MYYGNMLLQKIALNSLKVKNLMEINKYIISVNYVIFHYVVNYAYMEYPWISLSNYSIFYCLKDIVTKQMRFEFGAACQIKCLE